MKYYTPKIEELHIGFEYEVKLNSGEWVKRELSTLSELNFEDWSVKQNDVRVKYLDIEDIESLGYDVMKCASMFYKFGKDKDFFEYDFTNHILRIYVVNFSFVELEIKNKSELKNFLEMYKRWSA